MSYAMTAYLQKKLLDHTLNIAAWTMPTEVALSLHTASPGETGLLTYEIATGSYTRKTLIAQMGATNSTTGVSKNTAVVTFPVATADWGTITYLGISDALTAGNMLLYGALSVAKTVNTNGTVRFSLSQLSLQFD